MFEPILFRWQDCEFVRFGGFPEDAEKLRCFIKNITFNQIKGYIVGELFVDNDGEVFSVYGNEIMIISEGKCVAKLDDSNEHIFKLLFNTCQDFEKEWKVIFDSIPKKGLWEQWFNRLDHSGNPILSAVCNEKKIGVRIIQFFEESRKGQFVAYEDYFAKGEPEEVKELVIACWYNEENIEKAKYEIKKFLLAHDEVAAG